MTVLVAEEVEKGTDARFNAIENSIAELKEILASGANGNVEVVDNTVTEERLNTIDEAIAEIKGMLEEGVNANTDEVAEERFNKVEQAIAEVKEMLENGGETVPTVSEERLDTLENAIAEIKGMLENGAVGGVDTIVEEHYNDERLNAIEDTIAEIKDMLSNGVTANADNATEERFTAIEDSIARIREMFEEVANNGEARITEERFNAVEQRIAEIKEMLESGAVEDDEDGVDDRFNQIELKITEVKDILESGALIASAPVSEAAASSAVEKQEEEPLLKVSEIISQPAPVITPAPVFVPVEEDEDEEEEEDYDDGDRLEKDTDDSGDGEDLYFGEEGVDFSNMMKFNRSFIARIIQGTDQQKNFYGAVKQALLSYKKVNSNIAWGAERFNKGRETIARFKIRGKTLCLYLALDPNEYKVSVYHHLDASENKSMSGTPMMVKIKSPLGVKKAIRLIDEMLEARDGIKRDLLERDYAAMYPYETIEELIEEGLVKDVRKKNKG